MIDLSEEFCRTIGQKRREMGLSQTRLALEIGCRQSQLSMFEQGDGTKLNDEAIRKLSEKFSVPIRVANEEKGDVATSAENVEELAVDRVSRHAAKGFCPNPDCPTNTRYEVGGKVFALPARDKADPVGGKFCVMCGEVLEKRCPNCRRELHDGAVCTSCGKEYVVVRW